MPAQPPLLGAGRLRRHRVGGALAPRRHALVERADARPLHRRRRSRALARGGARGADAGAAGVRGAVAVAAHAARRALGLPRAARRAGGPRRARSTAGPCSRCGAVCWPTRSAPESAPVSCTDDRDRRGAPGRQRRPDGEGGAAVPHPRLHLPVGRDLRRLPLHLRLRPARGQHAAQRQERLVARHGPAARRRGRPRCRHPRPPGRVGGLGPPGHLHRPPGRLQELPRALAGRQDRRRLPQLRLARPHRGPGLQPDVQDPRRPGGGRGPRRLPAPRDGPGHVHQLRQRARHDAQEAALRHRPGRQVLPQRDHAAELRLPHPRVRADGDGVLRPARREPEVVRLLAGRAHGLVPRPRHPGREAPPAPPRAERAVALLARHGRRGVPLPLGLGRARGHRQPGRLRPARPTPRRPASRSTTSTSRPTSATRRT